MRKYKVFFYTKEGAMEKEETSSWLAFLRLRLTTKWYAYHISR